MSFQGCRPLVYFLLNTLSRSDLFPFFLQLSPFSTTTGFDRTITLVSRHIQTLHEPSILVVPNDGLRCTHTLFYHPLSSMFLLRSQIPNILTHLSRPVYDFIFYPFFFVQNRPSSSQVESLPPAPLTT